MDIFQCKMISMWIRKWYCTETAILPPSTEGFSGFPFSRHFGSTFQLKLWTIDSQSYSMKPHSDTPAWVSMAKMCRKKSSPVSNSWALWFSDSDPIMSNRCWFKVSCSSTLVADSRRSLQVTIASYIYIYILYIYTPATNTAKCIL